MGRDETLDVSDFFGGGYLVNLLGSVPYLPKSRKVWRTSPRWTSTAIWRSHGCNITRQTITACPQSILCELCALQSHFHVSSANADVNFCWGHFQVWRRSPYEDIQTTSFCEAIAAGASESRRGRVSVGQYQLAHCLGGKLARWCSIRGRCWFRTRPTNLDFGKYYYGYCSRATDRLGLARV